MEIVVEKCHDCRDWTRKAPRLRTLRDQICSPFDAAGIRVEPDILPATPFNFASLLVTWSDLGDRLPCRYMHEWLPPRAGCLCADTTNRLRERPHES